ncbi:MAG: hypothetical protein ACRC62_17400 [Microcoleus sp.]
MSVTNQKDKNINNFNDWILKIITLLFLVYLVSVPFGLVKKKFELTDLAIVTILLLFNSKLPERLQELGFNKDGITLKINDKLNELAAQQENQRANLEANTKIIQRLAMVEQAIANSKQEKRFLVKSLLSDYELQHLKKLANGTEFFYENRRIFQQELRHLRALGFIENHRDKHISSMAKKGDLREYFKITEQGKEYLKLKEELESADKIALTDR